MSNRCSPASFLCGAATALTFVYIYHKLTLPKRPSRRTPQQHASRSATPSTVQQQPIMDRPDLDMRLLRKAEAVIQGRTDKLIIVVERCTNDHNYSAILRTAEALGIQHCWIIDPPCITVTSSDDRLVTSSKGGQVQLSATEAEDRARHRLFAQNAQEWLTVRMFTNTTECLDALRAEGYAIWVTDLSQEATSLCESPAPMPERIAIVMGTEAVGCSKTMLDGADLRVYLPMVGFADSLNLSVATALVVQTMLIKYPQYASSMDEEGRHRLRQAWFPKLARQRLLTQRQKKDMKNLQRDIEKARITAAQQESGTTLDYKQQAKLDKLPELVQQLEQWDTNLQQQAESVVAHLIEQPPEPLSDLRRSDSHRVTFAGKNTKKRNAKNWKDMPATANAPALEYATASFFRSPPSDQTK